MKKLFYPLASLVLMGSVLTSCSKDSLEPEIATQLDIENEPVTSIIRLDMVLNGAYKYMQASPYYGRDYVIYNEVRTDNAYSAAYSGRFLYETDFATLLTHSYPADTWVGIYKVVAMSNIAIHSDITLSSSENQSTVDQYKAEAYALRALAHFDLMKLYGQQNVTRSTSSLTVPYITRYGSTITEENSYRLSLAEIKTAIENDLTAALDLVNSNVSSKTRINKQSILAIKARVAMYMAPFFGNAEYQIALDASREALNLGGQVISKDEFIPSFKSGEVAKNSIFELQFLSNDNLGNSSLYFIYGDTNYGDILAAENVTTLYDPLDVRSGIIGLDSYQDLRNLGKYVNRADNVKLIRYEELLLNIAECEMRIGSDTEALSVLNTIVTNRGLAPLTTVTLETVLLERRKELIFEGFRFDDLMRTQQNIPSIAERQAANTPAYGSPKLAFPIPQAEINVSSIPQNITE